jgi:ABC-2 type transport system ATP-binding protein
MTNGGAMLELDGVTRRFGRVTALDELSFTVGSGQLFGFVGSNGAGKTTAMRIVMGIDDPDAGEVRFDGMRLTRARRERFGYMPEERGLYPKVPARRQLTYLGRLHGMSREAGTLLERLGLGERADDQVEKLSLGNQQRVQLAAALIHDPDLLVLDEPFSGLDPIGVDALAGILVERAATGTPVVFSSHQLDLVERLCDAVAIIHAGRLVAEGAVDVLRDSDGGPVVRIELDPPSGSGADAPRFDPSRLRGVVGVQAPSPGMWHVELAPDADATVMDGLLDAARAAGHVRHFGRWRPSLADRYRQVVGT